MKKIFLILFSILFILFSKNAFAAKGKAAVYKVTMNEAALCTGNSSGTTCDGKVTIGSGDKEIDIAAVDAGSVAGVYGDATLLPLGVTYTHMWVKIGRKFILKSDDDNPVKTDDGDVCRTTATADSHFETDEATDKYTHKRAQTEGTGVTTAEGNYYMMNHGTDGVTICAGDISCGNTDTKNTITSTCSTCVAMKDDLDSDDAYHELIYTLENPYTVSLVPPTITMSFGTLEALSASDVGALCNIWAEEPVFTVNIK
jgi:hypothetical protein|tara:strand:+ start:453 stop:1223 length:771 start_codon:yes stop_codon:yes gene_type:complete